MIKKHPPLWVWISCAGLIAIAVLYFEITASVRTQMLRTRHYATFQHQMKNFLDHYSPDTNQCTVVCWGSSLSAQAIDHSKILQEQIADYDQNIDVQKMYMINSNSRVFPYIYEFFETTKQINPDLICIEDHLFSHVDRNIQKTKSFQEINYLLSSWSGHNPNTEVLPNFRNKDFNKFDRSLERNKAKDTLSYELHQRGILKYDDNKDLNKQLAFVLEQHIPLVILNLPRVGKVEKQMITPQKQAQIDRLIEEYRVAGFEIEYWKFPRYLPFKYYSDYAHLNREGRNIYSKWLSKKIAAKLADQCSN